MSVYRNIDVDFVSRTKKNLEYIRNNSIEMPEEITNFLNNCYGLLVLPVQQLENVLPLMRKDLSFYGIDPSYITSSKEKTFENIVRSLRNGFAHAHLQSLSPQEGDDFVAIKILDYSSQKDVTSNNPHTQIELSLEQLKKFVLKFSEEYLKQQEQLEKGNKQ